MARAPLIKILHHDDWFTDPESLGQFVAMMDEPSAVIGFSASRHADPDGTVTGSHHATAAQLESIRQDPLELFFGNSIGAPSTTICRITPADRFDARFRWLVDVDYYIQLLLRGGSLVYNDQELVCVMSSGAQRVTAATERNLKVQACEWSMLYEKLVPRGLDRRRADDFIGAYFAWIGVRSGRQIKDYGVSEKLARRFARCIRRRRFWQKIGNLAHRLRLRS
jgi:hypothetical protein